MKTINLKDAQTHLPRLVDEASKGEAFVIAKDGKAMVQVIPLDEKAISKTKRRLGFLEGRFSVPDDFDRMFAKEIEEMFYGKPK